MSDMDESWIGVIGVGIGAALAGVLSIVQVQLQRKGQVEALTQQFRAQEQTELRRFSAERWNWHAGLRRQSYIDCLISVEKCSGFVEFFEVASRSLITERGSTISAWTGRESPKEAIERFNRQMADETFDRVQVVRLDGPAEVSAQARKLLRSLLHYWEAAQRVADDRASSRSRSQDDHDKFMRIFEEFRDDITTFIALASASLAQSGQFGDQVAVDSKD
jgi:hypothetical protein